MTDRSKTTENLKRLKEEAGSEIRQIKKAATKINLPLEPREAKKIKAIWTVSGTGTYFAPLVDCPSDHFYLDRPWGRWMDRKRLNHAALVITKLCQTLGGKSINWHPTKKYSKIQMKEIQKLVQETGPYLIYNGVLEQNQAVLRASKEFLWPIPQSKIYIPSGQIARTIDQVKTLALPPDIEFGNDDIFGIVTHAPHYARLMRMIDFYRPLGNNVKIQLFPLVLPEDEEELMEMELNSTLNYALKNELSWESYPYEI